MRLLLTLVLNYNAYCSTFHFGSKQSVLSDGGQRWVVKAPHVVVTWKRDVEVLNELLRPCLSLQRVVDGGLR